MQIRDQPLTDEPIAVDQIEPGDEQITLEQIEPGMVVEATEGGIDERDVSQAKVINVRRDEAGNVSDVVVEKGTVFKKKITVPADRVQAVEPSQEHDDIPGKVKIDACADETDALAATGEEALVPAAEARARREAAANETDPAPGAATLPAGTTPQAAQNQQSIFRILGPGLLNGMAGNDSSAVTTYAVDGAQAGYGHLWLLLLMLPLMQAAQFASAKIGRLTGQGLPAVLTEHYGRRVSGTAAAALVIGNVALIAADLVAIGSGMSLITGLNWIWFIAPAALLLWYVTLYQDYEKIKRIFLALSLVFVTYLITAVLSKPDWGTVLSNTVIPHLDFGFAGISAAVALLGATISPYQLVWQAHGETEESRPGNRAKQLLYTTLDVASGVISGFVVSYAIIVSTAATLFTKHQPINSAIDAARALEPLVGPFAKYLFALGLIGSGLIAIPILLASTSVAVTGAFGWPASLAKKPWQNEGFYLILTVALGAGVILAALGFDPLGLIFWANIVQAFLAPILIVLVLLMGNNRKIMKDHRLGLLTNLALGLTAAILVAGASLLIYGLLTGQNS